MLEWEKLYWFLKFLIPKLIIKDKEQDALDELLNSIDLSTYGLERARIGVSIKLTYEETELDPQNSNPRGAYQVEEKSPLDEIIKNFNERWFDGWEATPEEQRVKFIHLMNKVKTHKDYEEKYSNNNDIYTRELALEKILNDVMVSERKKELELYKLFIQDRDFKQGMLNSFARALG